MKKVFHFVKSNNLSGLENVVINICTMVRGYDYTYVSTSGPINNILNKYGIKHIIVPNLNPVTLLGIIKKYRPNIVQAHDERMSVLLSFSGIYCHKHNIKMVSELHSDDPRIKNPFGLISILYALSSLFYEKIIVVSKNILNSFSYRYLIYNKTYIIPNVVNVNRIKNELSNNYTKLWDCIYLGRLSVEKRPLKFIYIIYELKKKYSNIKAIMVGTGNLYNKVCSLINKLHLTKNILVAGFKSNPYKYIQRSKILVITSRYEGFSLVTLESLEIGVPIVSTPLKMIKYLLGTNYVDYSKNNNCLAKMILETIQNKKRYRLKQMMGFKRLKLINNTDKFIKRYKQVYK